MYYNRLTLLNVSNVIRYCIIIFFSSFKLCNSEPQIYYAEEICSQLKTSVKYTLGVTGTTTSATIKATRSTSHSAPFDCNITFSTHSPNMHLLLNIKKTDFYNPESCLNYIKLYIQGDEHWKLCKDDEIITYISHRNSVTFTYHTENKGVFDSGFEVVFTAYTNLCTDVFNFMCNNKRCISKTLICDGTNNCGDQSDELTEKPSNCGLSGGEIAGIVLGVMLFACILLITIRNIRRRKQINSTAYVTKSDLNNT